MKHVRGPKKKPTEKTGKISPITLTDPPFPTSTHAHIHILLKPRRTFLWLSPLRTSRPLVGLLRDLVIDDVERERNTQPRQLEPKELPGEGRGKRDRISYRSVLNYPV